MKQSIESIWKKGFLENNELVAPKINDLYNQKSTLLIDKFKRMYRKNIIAIVIMALGSFALYYGIDAVWQGSAAALLLLALAANAYRLMQQMEGINVGLSSYDYLKSFDHWLQTSVLKTTLIMRVSYPLFVLIALCTIYFENDVQQKLNNMLLAHWPDLTLVAGIPLVGILAVALLMLLIGYFGDRIYTWDVRLVYGRVIDKLQETLHEMEELRGN